MLTGYGKIARIDLTSRKVEVDDVSEELAYGFLGGRGFAATTIFKEVSESVKGLDPENRLVVAAGPLTATFPVGGKTTFAAVSPQTDLYGDSNVGGWIGYRLRKASFDALVIYGASENSSYILAEDGKIEIQEAPELWGKGSQETDGILTKRYGEDCSVASIGIAGEKLVNYACVNVDWNRKKYRHGQAGRTGTGAVMGSKRLKAIVAIGTEEVSVADPDRLREVSKKAMKQAVESSAYDMWRRQGTMSVIEWANEIEALPTYNFQKTSFTYAKRIGGETMEKQFKTRSRPCSNCSVPCEHVAKAKYPGIGEIEIGVEYETAAMLGSNLGLMRFPEIIRANWMCDDLGIDTITAGSVMAFVTECIQRRLLSKTKVGLLPKFGNAKGVYRMIEMIARREGFGDKMAQGVKALSEEIGKGSQHFAMQVKGLEISAYDQRAAPAMGLSYGTCDIGAHHNRSWAITYDIKVGRSSYGEDKAEQVIYLQHLRPMFDMLGVCRFYWVELNLDPNLYAEAYSAVTGKEFTLQDLLLRAEKVWNLTRVIAALRQHIDMKEDMLPEREFADEIRTGKTKRSKLDKAKFKELLQTYYWKRGWDSEGKPTKDKLLELGLPEAAERLYSHTPWA